MNFIPLTNSVSAADRDLFITDVHVVADIAARDALVAQEGDIAKVTGDKTYIYDGAQWLTLNDNNGSVQSVNNINPVAGNVTLTTQNVTENTNLYYTDARVLTYLKTILTTSGDLLYRNGANLVRLPSSNTTGNLLTMSVSGLPVCDVKPTYNLNDLTDVNINQANADKMMIVYDGTNAEYRSRCITLSDCNDVNINNLTYI